MPTRRPQQHKKVRLTYRDHTEEQRREAIRAAMPEGSILFDFFCQVKYEDVQGVTEFDRGMAEGMRRLAGNLLDIVMEKQLKIESSEDATSD